jgi:hypothetical protein
MDLINDYGTVNFAERGRLRAEGTHDQPVLCNAWSGVSGDWKGIAFGSGSDYGGLLSTNRHAIIDQAGQSQNMGETVAPTSAGLVLFGTTAAPTWAGSRARAACRQIRCSRIRPLGRAGCYRRHRAWTRGRSSRDGSYTMATRMR